MRACLSDDRFPAAFCESGAEDTLRTISDDEVNAVFRKLTSTDWPCSLYEVDDIISSRVTPSKGIWNAISPQNHC